MKLQIIVILLATAGIVTGVAQLGDEQIFITVTSEGKAKVSQSIFPETFVSTIDVQIISEKISNLLAIDEENILLGTSQDKDLLKIATLGASGIDLKYNADILSYESGVFKLKYNSNLESRVNLPPLSKLVSLNTIPIEITDEEYILPPGDISLSFTIRPVTSKEFFVSVDDSEYKVETITAAKIEGFSANSDEIQFIIKDKAIVLTIIPTQIMANPNDASLNGEKVDFTQFHKNSTHSWIRIDPHEKGLVKILDTTEKTEEGGGCLIATATYGTEMAPQVQLLREIRDNQLMGTDSGTSFIAGFNSFYYSFSPHVADMEREHPMFKEMVKIGITPLLSSLSVMEYAETDEEIFGLGISVILMNIGMYFVLPFVICYQGMKIMRTKRLKKSKWAVISNCNVRSVLKISLVGLIALFVLSVSIPSVFAQTDSESESPLRMVLDITYQNIVESITDSGMEQGTIDLLLDDAEEEYNESIALIEGGDIVAAKQDVVLTMSYFENIAEDIAKSNPVPDQLTPGFGAGIGSASDIGITQGQGLGVGGVPPGIFNQISAANTFAVSEAITSIDEEVGQYRELAKLNNLDGIDFGEFDESVNLAKTLLANGVVPDAQVKLELANQIKDDLLQKIQDAANENSAADIEQYMDEQKNLGLTQKDIRELEGILENITTVDNEETGDSDVPVDSGDTPGNSANAPGQNQDSSGDDAPGNSANAPGQNQDSSGDDAPGNSANAPGQNKDNSEDDSDLPPGFESATENGNGLGVGKIPPGLAKLFENTDTDLPPGFESATENGNGLGVGNIPPGQLKKFDSYEASFEQSPDDFYENSFEASIDGTFETNFDGTNKGNGDGKGKFGAFPGKSGEAPGQNKDSNKNKGGNGNGNNNTTVCHNGSTLNISGNALAAHLGHGDTEGACGTGPGIYDAESSINTGVIGTPFSVNGFTAIANNNSPKALSDITLDIVFAGNSTTVLTRTGDLQPFTFTPDVNGTWNIVASSAGLTDLTRVVNIGNIPPTVVLVQDVFTIDTGMANGDTMDASGSFDTDGSIVSYSWVRTDSLGGAGLNLSATNVATVDFWAPNGASGKALEYTVTVTDNEGGQNSDTVTINVN